MGSELHMRTVYRAVGSHGASECATLEEAAGLAADRQRLYPELGPFRVESCEVYERRTPWVEVTPGSHGEAD